jgi:hypothetical protein
MKLGSAVDAECPTLRSAALTGDASTPQPTSAAEISAARTDLPSDASHGSTWSIKKPIL